MYHHTWYFSHLRQSRSSRVCVCVCVCVYTQIHACMIRLSCRLNIHIHTHTHIYRCGKHIMHTWWTAPSTPSCISPGHMEAHCYTHCATNNHARSYYVSDRWNTLAFWPPFPAAHRSIMCVRLNLFKKTRCKHAPKSSGWTVSFNQYMYKDICAGIQTCRHECVRACVPTYIHAHTHKHIHSRIYTHIHTHIYIPT